MHRGEFVLITSLLVTLLFTGATAADNEPPPGFRALFNGKDLTGWYGMGHVSPRKLVAMTEEERGELHRKGLADIQEHWRAANGELVNDGHGLYLTTDEWFGDVELLVDYRTVARADSGIYLRATPQIQIWDYTKEGGKWGIGADKGSGGLWNNSQGAPGKDPLVLADRPFGEWNRFRIIQVGSYTTVYLNGKLVVDHAVMENWHNRKLPLAPKGPIQLQTHGGEIRWKNIFLREIPDLEANYRLQKPLDGEGFRWVFNGENMDGWLQNGDPPRPLKNYKIQEGALIPGGGTVFVNEIYSDFIARLEIKLPRRGNNGLAIRYPGNGDTAYVGMCELQILDNPSYMRDNLKDCQFHGSAYCMVPALRGYLRPAGQWNFQEVTVRGSRIKVELNGAVILDTDLGKVKAEGHPGKDRTSGYFGFAGHGSDVMFRNIRIKRLD